MKKPSNHIKLDGRETVKLLRGREVLIDMFGEVELLFLNHVHKLDACDGSGCSMHFFETPHGGRNPFDMTVILFDDIVEIFGLAQNEFSLAR